MAFGDSDGPCLKICCGPRCGAYPGHRAIYKVLEQGMRILVRPVLCQGLCGNGVTVVQSAGEQDKIASITEARIWLQKHSKIEDSENYGNR